MMEQQPKHEWPGFKCGMYLSDLPESERTMKRTMQELVQAIVVTAGGCNSLETCPLLPGSIM